PGILVPRAQKNGPQLRYCLCLLSPQLRRKHLIRRTFCLSWAMTHSGHKTLVALFLATTLLATMPLVHGALLTSQYSIHDHGQRRTFIIATNELQIAGKRQPERIAPLANPEAIRRQAQTLSRSLGKEVRLVLYPQASA